MRFRPSFRNSGSQSFSTFCMLSGSFTEKATRKTSTSK
jgi:hypothetical protein